MQAFKSVSAGKTRIPSYGSMALRKAMDGGRSAAVRLLNYAKDGTPLWNQLSVLPLRCGGIVLLHTVCDCGSVVRRTHCTKVLSTMIAAEVHTPVMGVCPGCLLCVTVTRGMAY